MKSKLIHAILSLAVFTGLSVAFVALVRQPHLRADEAAVQEAGDERRPPGNAAGTEAAQRENGRTPEGQETAGPAEPNELFKTRCEHDVAIIDCDECRYEAGVAKIDPALAQGLIETQAVRAEQHAGRRLNLTGEVQLDLTRVVEIASAGAGRVEEIRRILGDTVAVPDVLAVIQSSEFGTAQAAFLEARAKLDLAQQTHEREKQLREQKISSEADYLVARSELATAQAMVSAARKRLQLFGLSHEQIESFAKADSEAPFGQLTLTAPISGTIIDQSIIRGQLIDATHTLYRIADLSRVWVWCNAYESDLAALHERVASGRPVPAEIRVGAFAQTTFRGTVDMIGSQLDRETRTLKVRVVADNPEGRLKPGMFVKVSIDLDGSQTVLRAPATAVLSDAGQDFVFTRLTDELWVRRDVTVGPVSAGLVEVHSGLNDGDVIATKGAFMFKSEILKEKMGAGCAH